MLFPLPLETGCKTIPESGSSLKEEAKVDKRSTVNIIYAALQSYAHPRVEIPSGRPSMAHIPYRRDPENFTCLHFLKLPKRVKMQYRDGYIVRVPLAGDGHCA